MSNEEWFIGLAKILAQWFMIEPRIVEKGESFSLVEFFQQNGVAFNIVSGNIQTMHLDRLTIDDNELRELLKQKLTSERSALKLPSL